MPVMSTPRAMSLLWGLWLMAATTGSAQAPAPWMAEPPRFADPTRGERLATAFPEIDRLFREYAEADHVPGIAWGVVVDGRMAHAGAHGLRDVAAGSRVDRNTVFRIASMTKSLTALAILKLRDDGLLTLDDPVERHVPELAGLRYPTTDAPRITIRHLLTHAGGFPEDNPWGDRQLAMSEGEMTRLLRSGIPFANTPGVTYEYSNFGFAILGRVVSVVSGRPYGAYLEQAILEPLDMRATTLQPADVRPDRFAHGYRRVDDAWTREPALADGAFGAMGGLLTSIDDLGRYVAFMLSAWPPRDADDTGPVRRASVREMQQVWRMRPAVVTGATTDSTLRLSAGGYGYGLRVTQSCDFRHIVGHAGGLPGYGSLMTWLPDYGVGLVAVGNLTYTAWGPRFDAALAALSRTGALRPRVVHPSSALLAARDAVHRLMADWDGGAAESLAADNLFLDRSHAERRADFDAVRARHGRCVADEAWDVDNALRGAWTLRCDRGHVRVAVTLSPTVPTRVQHLAVSSVDHPETHPTLPCPSNP